jgi:hypothetical protein
MPIQRKYCLHHQGVTGLSFVYGVLLTINTFLNPEMGDLEPHWPAPSLKKKKMKKMRKRRKRQRRRRKGEGGGGGKS